MNYLVLIADIVDSRNLEARGQVQKQLTRVLNNINRRGAPIASPYTLTLGDEFQAVFSSADRIFEDMVWINHVLHPVHVRFSYGVGEITTAINTKQALGMDGPAFYAAREGLERLKGSDTLATVAGLAGPVAALIDASVRVLANGMAGWRANRFAILRDLMCGDEVKRIAARLEISEVAVYKNIDAGDLRNLLRLTQALEACLDQQMALEAA